MLFPFRSPTFFLLMEVGLFPPRGPPFFCKVNELVCSYWPSNCSFATFRFFLPLLCLPSSPREGLPFEGSSLFYGFSHLGLSRCFLMTTLLTPFSLLSSFSHISICHYPFCVPDGLTIYLRSVPYLVTAVAFFRCFPLVGADLFTPAPVELPRMELFCPTRFFRRDQDFLLSSGVCLRSTAQDHSRPGHPNKFPSLA